MRVNKCIVNVFHNYREFLRIFTVPLLSMFFTKLDRYSPRLVEIFSRKGGQSKKKKRKKRIATDHSSSSSPLLSLVTSTSEISHQPVHTYTTYIWQRGKQNRKTGNGRKVQHLHEEREEKIFFTPDYAPLGVQCENRKKNTSAQKHIYHRHNLQQGEHIQHWQAAIRSGAICGAGHRPAQQRDGTKCSEAVWSGGVMSVIGEGTRASRCSVLSQG